MRFFKGGSGNPNQGKRRLHQDKEKRLGITTEAFFVDRERIQRAGCAAKNGGSAPWPIG
jgi:hypothetical protein